MSKLRFLIVNLSFCLLLIGSITSPVQAADRVLGCCIKTEKADPHTKTYSNISKEECVATDNDPWTVEFKSNLLVSTDKTKCEDKPKINERKLGDPIFFKPSVSIPDSKYIAGQDVKIEESTSALANYIVAIFKYSTGVIGIIAAIVLMLAGIMWVTAAGNQEQIGSAKKMIGGGLMGLILTFGAFVILSMVNTNLVNLKITPVTKIQNIPLSDYGCCKKYGQDPLKKQYTTQNMAETDCEKLKEQINPDGYKDIVFIPYARANNDECDQLGCCTLSGGSHIRQAVMFEKECKDKMSIGGLAEGFSLMSQEELADKEIGGPCVLQIETTN